MVLLERTPSRESSLSPFDLDNLAHLKNWTQDVSVVVGDLSFKVRGIIRGEDEKIKVDIMRKKNTHGVVEEYLDDRSAVLVFVNLITYLNNTGVDHAEPKLSTLLGKTPANLMDIKFHEGRVIQLQAKYTTHSLASLDLSTKRY